MPENPANPTKKQWAVLIYMVADDPQGGELLDQQANRELDRIVFASMGADRSKLHVAVQVDYRSQRDVWRRVVGEGSWRHPESDAADPETLYGFFQWAKEKCPAERYLLMFWGHSRSLFGLFTDADPWEYVAQTLTLTELRTALQAATASIGRELDIVVFKDCYMSTLETACELKGLASYLVASQSLVPIEGWPYSEMFGALIAHTNDPKKAALQIVGDLEHHYSDEANRDGFPVVPYALLDTSKAEMVNAALTPIVARLADIRTSRTGKKVRTAIAAAAPRKPGDTSLLDVQTMCRKLKAFAETKEMARSLEQAVFGEKGRGDNKLVLRHYPERNSGTRVFGGVSVFNYPAARAALEGSLVAGLASRKVYEALQFTESGWNEIALEAMPEAPPARLTRYSSDGIPELARQLLPLMILDQLQSQGLLEQLQREAFGMAQSTIASLVTARGFIEGGSGKPQGFVSEPGSGKPQGFVSEPGSGKPQGFGPAERVVKAHKAVKGRRGLKRQKPLKLRVLKPVEFTASKQRHKQKEKPAIRIRRPNRHAYESVVKTA